MVRGPTGVRADGHARGRVRTAASAQGIVRWKREAATVMIRVYERAQSTTPHGGVR